MFGGEIREENCSDLSSQGEQFAGTVTRICHAAKADGADVWFRSDICEEQHQKS